MRWDFAAELAQWGPQSPGMIIPRLCGPHCASSAAKSQPTGYFFASTTRNCVASEYASPSAS